MLDKYMMQLKTHIQADSNSRQATICRPVQGKGWEVLHVSSFGQVQLRLGMNAFASLRFAQAKLYKPPCLYLSLQFSSVQLSSAQPQTTTVPVANGHGRHINIRLGCGWCRSDPAKIGNRGRPHACDTAVLFVLVSIVQLWAHRHQYTKALALMASNHLMLTHREE